MTHPYAIYILIALQKKSNADHPINREGIRDFIIDTFKANPSVKTITDNIKALDSKCKKFISIKHVGNNGYYLENNGSPFTVEQISYLMDAVFSSPEISSDAAVEINNNLLGLLNDDNAKNLKRVASHVLKPKLVQSAEHDDIFAKQGKIFWNMSKNCNIKFTHPLFPQFKTMSPYYLFNKNGYYYVIGSVLVELDSPLNGVRFEDQLYVFRVDHLNDMKGTTEKRTPIENVGLSGRLFNLEKYISSRNLIEEGAVTTATKSAVIVYKSPLVTYAIKDTFGNNAVIEEKNGYCEASIRNDENSILEFAFSHAGEVEIVKPAVIRDKLIKKVTALANKYKEAEVPPRAA